MRCGRFRGRGAVCPRVESTLVCAQRERPWPEKGRAWLWTAGSTRWLHPGRCHPVRLRDGNLAHRRTLPSDRALAGRSPELAQPTPCLNRRNVSRGLPSRGSLALRILDVAKRFGRAIALDRASLELRTGERLALLGPNGAGKTTLVRCISGRAVPDSGQIEMFDRPLPPTGGRQRLGFVPRRSPSIRT